MIDMPSADKLLLRALAGEVTPRPPIWLMRQAGRYLPEYLQTRRSASGFLDLCFTPDSAIEVTLQPIRRYGFDAAIIFSDILVVPHALGQKVWFEEGHGPRLEALSGAADVERLAPEHVLGALEPVFQAIRGVSAALPAETALIGFAGAPWTVASYMIEGGSSKDFAKAKTWAYGEPQVFQSLIDLLVETTSEYLVAQVGAGAEVLQLFDSWAGVWPADQHRRWCLEPCREIVRRLKEAVPQVPVIVFPRGAGVLYQAYAAESGAAGLGLDTTVPPDWARDNLQGRMTLQGNLDPLLLVSGGEGLRRGAQEILDTLSGGPFIFNLGHGILPQTPPAHVAALVDLVRA
jgi:uroporphyrinogen decarboxylase